MKRLHFKNAQDFENLFEVQDKDINDHIVDTIEETMKDNKKSAHIYTISFDQADFMYEIVLPSTHWVAALESCLEFYHENSHADEAINCWEVLECAKVW